MQDYYGDLIGLPRQSRAGLPRSLAGATGLPYALDRLIPSGAYRLAGSERVDGEDCVILERSGLDRLWLAERRAYAIVRREWRWTVGGPLKRVIRNGDFREVAPGRWLPWRGEMDLYGSPNTRPSQKVGTLVATLEAATVAVPDDLFEPHFPPGRRIYDLDTGTHVTIGRPDQASLDRLIAEAQEHRGAIRRTPSRWSHSLIAAAMLVGVVVVALRLRRRALLLLPPSPEVFSGHFPGS